MTSQAKLQEPGKPKRGRPPDSTAKETRLKLLRSAASEFSSAEYSQVSLVAIARNVGLTSTAIYNHFASKDDLFLATAKHLMTVNLDGIERAVAGEDDWKAKLRAILDLIKSNETGWLRFPLLTPAVQLKSMRDPEEFADILRLRKRFVLHFVALVKSAQEAGDMPKDIPINPTGELLLAFTFNGLGATMGHSSNEEDVSQLVQSFSALLRLTD